MARVISPRGTETTVKGNLNLEQAQDVVGGYVEVVRLNKGKMLVNEDGISLGLELNILASIIAEQPILGTVAIVDGRSW